jgi:hypothetical protein
MIGPVRAADRRMNRFDVGTLNMGIVDLTGTPALIEGGNMS